MVSTLTLRKIFASLAATAIFGSSWQAWAGRNVPVQLKSAIIVRSAGYERGFAERSGEAVLAVISGKSGSAHEDGDAMAAAFTKLLANSSIAGRKTHVVNILHESAAKTAANLRSERAEIVYFAQGLESVIKDIPAREGGWSRIVFCANGEDVASGCALGVELADDTPRLVLNLKQSNAAGLRFQPELLRLARIVR